MQFWCHDQDRTPSKNNKENWPGLDTILMNIKKLPCYKPRMEHHPSSQKNLRNWSWNGPELSMKWFRTHHQEGISEVECINCFINDLGWGHHPHQWKDSWSSVIRLLCYISQQQQSQGQKKLSNNIISVIT